MAIRFIFLVLMTFDSIPCLSQILALPNAYSQNDQKHENPFYDAINHGFLSIEVNTFPTGNDLIVVDDSEEMDLERTLSSLYLEPLFDIVKIHNGWMFEEDQSLILLIDFKAFPKESLSVLRERIKPYRKYLSSFSISTGFQKRGVTIIISGERPISEVVALDERWVFLDGRLSDPPNILNAELSPIISCSWKDLFSWRGEGDFPQSQREKLQRIVSYTHSKRLKLRFWHTPDQEELWKVLLQEKIDLIGTEDLGKLKNFLISEIWQW